MKRGLRLSLKNVALNELYDIPMNIGGFPINPDRDASAWPV